MIHPTAVIHPSAKIHPTANVGPYCIVDGQVTIGAGCVLGPHVHITGNTTMGEANVVHTGAVLGGAPQDLKYNGDPTILRIGNGNVFREMVTVHTSNSLEEETVIGDENLLMVNSHVAHNCHLGNKIILVNGALLGGHVKVDDRAIISGNCVVHQFVRIGELAMLQGGTAVSFDVPPFVIACSKNMMAGLNSVGLRRAGYTSEERLELKNLYKILFCSRLKREDAIYKASLEFHLDPSRKMLDFMKIFSRGFVAALGTIHTSLRG